LLHVMYLVQFLDKSSVGLGEKLASNVHIFYNLHLIV